MHTHPYQNNDTSQTIQMNTSIQVSNKRPLCLQCVQYRVFFNPWGTIGLKSAGIRHRERNNRADWKRVQRAHGGWVGGWLCRRVSCRRLVLTHARFVCLYGVWWLMRYGFIKAFETSKPSNGVWQGWWTGGGRMRIKD